MTCLWFSIVIFLCVWKENTCNDIFNDTKETNNLDELKINTMRLANSIADWVLPKALKVEKDSRISTSCRLSLLQFFTAFKELREWALKMFDASAKPPAGVLYGRVIVFGDYEECLDVVAMNTKGNVLFEGKYCMVKVELPDFVFLETSQSNTTIPVIPLRKSWRQLRTLSDGLRSFRFGLCVPSTCTGLEVNRLLDDVTRTFGFATNVSCEAKLKKAPNTEQIVIICIFVLFGFLIVIGTSLDFIKQHVSNFRKKSGDFSKLLTAFSLSSNTVRLFCTHQNDKSLSAIRACRVISIFWIVVAHVCVFPHDFYLAKYSRLTDIFEFLQKLTIKTLMNASLALDTLFLISGMLFVYTTWRDLKTKRWINPLTYLPSRIARLLLIEMLVIALFMILPLFGEGPIWDETFKEPYDACVNNWWTNLLFIQNYWPVKQMCLLHTWFIGTLLQLNLLTFGIPLLLHRWPKFGISINLLLILIGCIVIAIQTLSYDLPATLSDFVDHINVWQKYSSLIHFTPYTYFDSYCIGIFLGYAIVIRRPKIKPYIRIIFWLLATCGILTTLFGDYFLHVHYNRLLHVAYAALHRIIWSSCIFWILFASVNGYGGIVGRFLSWKCMIPLDRLSFLAYLLHPLLLYYQTARTRAVIYIGSLEQVYMILATVVLTLCFSYLFNITVEQPLNYLRLFVLNKFFKKAPEDISDANIARRNRHRLSLSSIVTPESELKENNTSQL